MEPYPPPHYPGESPKRGLQTWQVLTAIALGSFLGVVVVCGGGGALTMLFFQQQITSFNNIVSGNYGTIPNLSYSMQVPANAVEGQPFEIELTLDNTGTSPMTLYSLNDYSGLTLIQCDPPWQSRNGSEMLYQLPLPPGQPVTLKVTAQANGSGTQSLNIDAYTDGGLSWAEAYGTIIVTPATPTPAAPTPTPPVPHTTQP